MRKAFIHVVEIIVIIIAVFVILTQFSYMPGDAADWETVRIRAVAGDVLHSLDRKGINWFSQAEVRAGLDSVLPSNLMYSVRLNNVIKPLIRAGCVCSQQEFSDMQSLFTPFAVNGVVISYNLTRTDPADPVFSTFNDVYIVMDYNLTPFGGDLGRFLSQGKGVVEIRDLDAQGDADLLQEEVFGLHWDSSVGTTIEGLEFTGILPESAFYGIVKYFYNIPNSSGHLFQEPHVFGDFLEPQEHLNVSGRGTAAILRQLGTERAPGCAARVNVQEGSGRSAWLSAGPLNEERGVLIKSLATWAAGESYDVVENPMKKSASVSMLKVLNQDMYQLIEVVLKVGYLY